MIIVCGPCNLKCYVKFQEPAMKFLVGIHGTFDSSSSSRSETQTRDPRLRRISHQTNHTSIGCQVQWDQNGGKCGLCGDRWDGPLKNQPGPDNIYAQGVIVKQWMEGQEVTVSAEITAHHKGENFRSR